MDADGNDKRERLEAEADVLRSRLATTLEALDQRWHDAFDVKLQATRHPLPTALVGAGTFLVVAGGTGLAVYRSKQRKRQLMSARLGAIARMWHHPERVARPQRGSFLKELARGVLVGLGSYAITELAKVPLSNTISRLRQARAAAAPSPQTTP